MKILFVAMLLVGLSYPAQAKPPNEPIRTKFYDFGELLIDGEVKKPKGLLIEERTSPEFGRLLRLKKSFLPSLMETAREKVFR